MKKLNLNILIYRLLLIVFLTSFSQVFFAQVIKTFTQRTSVNTPGKLIYNIKGDYTMIGNTNLTVVPYGDNTLNSNNPMAYVDVDSDPNTLNSSSATLQLSNENGADPNCSNIIYAGLYWTGRASNLSNSPESFNVTKGGVTKNYNKRTVSLKGPGETNYTQFVANPGNIFYPDGTYGNMYSAFVEVTNYVRATGIGEYTVADIALIEGNGGATGYYGGWGLIVIYENSKMNWRDVTVFDGHAYVTGGTSVNYQLPVSGFNTVQSGQVNMKLGMMAGEGDVGINGDYFRIRNWQDNAWVTLNHANNTSNNFFNSSINTGGNSRNPNLQNNTGLDIAMFNVPNVGNSVITNNQTSTTFQYGSTQDTYIIFCMAMSVDAYIPDVESLVSTEFINGIPVGSGNITGEPGDIINYSVQLKNLGTEPVDNLKITVPIPYSANYVLGSAIGTINFSPIPTPNTITLDPTIGANGSIVWDFGTLPLPPPGFPDSVLAELSFNLEITTDCNILTNPNCPPNVTLAGGYVTGIGSISGSRFILPFIQGYENAGPCLGEPITDPLIIDIDADAYVAVNCINTPTEREFLFCDYTIATIPVSEIAGDFPSGLRFFNTNNITPTSIEYDLNNPFPATPGTFTYFGIPEGVSMCYYTFTITVQGPMVANTTVTSNVSCIGESDGEILTTIIGGTSPYSFAWNGPIPFTSTNQNISALAAGTYNLIATDNIGCTDSSTVILTTIPDNTAPSFTCPSNIIVNNSPTFCFATVNYISPIAVDNCPGVVSSLTTGLTSGSNFSVGTHNVVYEAIDLAGNTATCSFTVTVNDVQLPTISCPSNINATTDLNSCVANATSISLGSPITADNCGIASVTNNAPTSYPIGVTNVVWTVTDIHGNSQTCNQTVTISDNQNPAITCAVSGAQNVVTNTGVCTFTQSTNAWNASASDNCGVTSLTYTLTGATTGTGTSLNAVIFNIGTTNVLWTASDATGNTTTCSFTVVVTDNQNPVITCAVTTPQNVFTNSGICTYTHNTNVWNASATDNCGITSLTYSLTGATTGSGNTLNGQVFNIGTTTVTWLSSDAAGNQVNCIFNVIVTDNQNPSLTCAVTGSQNIVTNAGVCTYIQTTNGWNASATDNCGVTSLTYALTGATTGTGTDLTNVIFNLGSTIVTWTAADAQGNSVNCSFTVVVLDNQAPSITCAVTGAQNVIADANVCTFTQTTSIWDASATDFCGVTSLTYALTGATTGTGTSLAGVVFNPGTTTVTWTARDAANNSISCSFTVTVADSEAPVISCAVSGTQQVNVNTGICTFTQNTTLWNPTASDNCGTVTFSYILSGATSGSGTTLSGQVFNLGTTLVTWTVQDATGNTDVCSFSVEVSDNINPVIVSCGQGSQTVVTDFATCSYTQTGTAWNPIATDNCGNVNLSYVLTGATLGSGTSLENIVFNLGATIVTWTISDDNGNSVNCSYTITVTDNQLPSITSCGATGNQSVVSDLNTCTYTQINNSWDATATDFCGVTSLTYQLSGATNGSGTSLVGVEFNIGITTVTWTARDAANNLTTCTFDVTVTDAEAPQIICGVSVDQNVITDNGVCSFTQTSTSWNASAGDNCSVASLTYSLSGATTGSGTSLFGVSFGIGTTNVVWTAMDAEGNTSSCSFEVLVQDIQAPSILTCGAPVNQTVNTNIGMCTFTQTNNGWNALATDNCGSVSLSYLLTGATSGSGSTLNGVSFNLGLTTVEWTATDNSNNTTTCTFTVTVLDNQVPVIVNCQSNQVVSADNACEYELPDYTSLITFTDNCSATINQSPIAGTLVGLGVTSITITVTDQSGNATLCNFSITVNDTEAPVIDDCPNNITMSNDAGNCGAFVTWTAPTATDNCSVSLSSTHASGDFFTVGSTIVSYTAIDPSGNQVTCSFTVTVNDTELPNLVCPTNIESCDSLVFFNDALASDNCGIQSIQLTSSLASGSLFPIGTTSVTFEAIDIHMNSTTCSFDVIINPTPVLSFTQTNVLCNGAANGSLTLNITNGTPIYNILWSNSETTTTITGLAPQDYTATVVDNNGCQAAITATITEPLALTAIIEVTDVVCFGENNGALEAIPSGGTLPYSFVWNNGTLTADNNNLTANDYDVTITDGNNCSITLQSEVTQPDSIVITTFINNATCLGDNGSIMTNVIGGTLPYSFEWSNGTFNQNLVNAISGVYTLTLTDFNGCTSLISDSVGTENNLTAIVRVSDVSCYGENNGYASVAVVTGNEPYQYIWSNGIETYENISISAGLYDVTIIDFYGCEITLPAIINQPDSLFITFDTPTHNNGYNVSTYGGTDGQISSIVNGGTLPYEYVWSNGETTSDLSQLSAGEYTLVVSDFNGCVAYNLATLNQPFVLEMPNGISPNNDGLNDFFVVRGLEAFSENEILIYNRWGNLVYERKNYDNTWAATNSKGEELPDATYFVILTVKTGSDDIVLTGYVDVRRK